MPATLLGLGTLLGRLAAPDVLQAKRKHKKKKKKHKKPGQGGSPPASPPPVSGDEAPPCTDASCPLPPECAQSVFDTCTTALFTTLQADAEACRPSCQAGDSPACRACLQPIVNLRLPEVQGCIEQACPPSDTVALHLRATAIAGPIMAEAWWARQCSTPTCCYDQLNQCWENTRDEYTLCMTAALIAIFVSGPVGGGVAAAICLARIGYNDRRCESRFGCANGRRCRPGNDCCLPGYPTCGASCCNEQTAHCCAQPDGTAYCCPSNRRCCSTGGPQCCV
jgi:hypothetical protein